MSIWGDDLDRRDRDANAAREAHEDGLAKGVLNFTGNVPNVYALRVRGDAMFNPAGPRSYPDGCIVFVDPNKRQPKSGDRVIAQMDGTGETTFKVYTEEAGKVFLKPLNPEFPDILAPFKVVGTVVYKGEPQ